jgi:hypothetical protein
MMSADKHLALDYEQRGDLCPIQTTIQIEETADGTRFIDPPNVRNVIESIVGALLALVVGSVLFIALKPWHLGATWLGPWWPKRVFGALTSLLFIYAAVGWGRIAARFAKYPTIIEIGPEQFRITWPSKNSKSFPVEQIDRIALDTSIPFLPDGKWLNSLRIEVGSRGYLHILAARPRAEIEWFATQLRAKLAKHKPSFGRVNAISYSGTYRNRASKHTASPGGDPAQYVQTIANTVLVFPRVDFATGANAVVVRISNMSGGQIELRVGTHSGKAFAAVTVPPSDVGWRTVSGRINPAECPKGLQRVYVTVCGNGSPMRIDYFQLQAGSTSPEESG